MFSRTFFESVSPEVLHAVDRAYQRVQLQEAQINKVASNNGAHVVSHDPTLMDKATRLGAVGGLGVMGGLGAVTGLAHAYGVDVPGVSGVADAVADYGEKAARGLRHLAGYTPEAAKEAAKQFKYDQWQGNAERAIRMRGSNLGDLRQSDDNISMGRVSAAAREGHRRAMGAISQLHRGSNLGDLQAERGALNMDHSVANAAAGAYYDDQAAGYNADALLAGLGGLGGAAGVTAAAMKASRSKKR